jgi:hypothetical protein
VSREDLRIEARMLFSVIGGLFFGRTVWLPPEEITDVEWVGRVQKSNLMVVQDIYRHRLTQESDGVESVRRRAEFALTATIAVIGLSIGAFERLWEVRSQSLWPLGIWGTGLLVVAVSILVFAGVAVSKKVMGSVNVQAFAGLKNGQREELRQYVGAVEISSRTRRAMVTVFRDGFLLALVGLALIAIAHALSWTFTTGDPPELVVVQFPFFLHGH